MPTKLIDLEAALRIADELDDMPSSFKSRDPDGDYCDGWRAACGEMAEALRALPAATGAWTEEALAEAIRAEWRRLVDAGDSNHPSAVVAARIALSRPTGAVVVVNRLTHLDGIGLHDAIHVIYAVDSYIATREIRDGGGQSHEAIGETVYEALANLDAALRPAGEPADACHCGHRRDEHTACVHECYCVGFGNRPAGEKP